MSELWQLRLWYKDLSPAHPAYLVVNIYPEAKRRSKKPKIPLYFRVFPSILTGFMDKFWSIFAMPLGLVFCFAPALLAWIVMELKDPSSDKSDRH